MSRLLKSWKLCEYCLKNSSEDEAFESLSLAHEERDAVQFWYSLRRLNDWVRASRSDGVEFYHSEGAEMPLLNSK